MFSLPVRVYWEDTDAGGIVFYANYLKFMERARTEWLRSRGIAQHTLKQVTGGMFIVTDTQIKYLRPARLDDVLLVSAQIVQMGRARIVIAQDVRLQTSEDSPGDPALERMFHQDSARRAQNRDGWVRDATNRGRAPSQRNSAAPDARVWDAGGAESFCGAPVGFDIQQRSRADDNAQNDAPGERCGLVQPSALICQGTICIAWVDGNTLKPGRIPVSVMEALR